MCSSLPVVLNVATEVVTNFVASPGACLQPGTQQEDEHSRSAILDILHQDDDVEVHAKSGRTMLAVCFHHVQNADN